ncbi:MAG: S8 family peptidase [Patescibacteria group bacterium]
MRFSKRKSQFLISFLIITFNLVIFLSPAAALRPNDPDYFLQWYVEKINLPQAWDYTVGSEEVIVAVLDTGVDIDHPDLSGNIWINYDEVDGDGIDNDNNGYADDIYGWNFVDKNNQPWVDFSKDYSFEGANHGTLIAGLIAAQGDNLWGITGVTWKSKIMSLKVLDNNGMASIGPTVEAIDYAINNGADVLNLSFQGNFPYSDLQAAIERAHRAGVVVVAASGNAPLAGGLDLDVTPFYPVCYKTLAGKKMVVGVGSTDERDYRSTFSNYGSKCLDLSAPGQEIYSTQIYIPNNKDFNQYYGGGWEGTSLAAPLVSGAAALLKSINKEFTPTEVLDLLTDNTDNIDQLNPVFKNGRIGAGRLNVGKAVWAAIEYNKNRKETVVQPPLVNSQPTFSLDSKLIVAPTTGYEPMVQVYNQSGVLEKEFLAYQQSFRGGVNLAVGDVNLDGVKEIITAANIGGGPHVRIFDVNGKVLAQFFAYDRNFLGGVNVVAGDVDADQRVEIVTAPASDLAPWVKIFDNAGNLKKEFLAYDKKMTSGVNLAVGDINLDGSKEIITAANIGGGPHVRIFDATGKVLAQFFAYDRSFLGGVKIAAGDVDANQRVEIVTVPAGQSAPWVKIFDNAGNLKKEFLAYDQQFLGGANLAVGDYDKDGWADLVLSQRRTGRAVKIFDYLGQVEKEFSVFGPSYNFGLKLAIIE